MLLDNSMSGKSTAQLCEEAIEGWRKALNLCDENVAPIMAAAGFQLGKSSKKERLAMKKESPEAYELLIDNIKKGMKLASAKNCSKCNMNNDSDASFCKGCGTKLE
jgi:hypothetical protein